MSTMNNEDPADPSVPNHVLECIYAYGDARADDDGNSGRRLGIAVVELRNWCADQMREAIAAERERSHELLQAADHIHAGLDAAKEKK